MRYGEEVKMLYEEGIFISDFLGVRVWRNIGPEKSRRLKFKRASRGTKWTPPQGGKKRVVYISSINIRIIDGREILVRLYK